MGGAGLEEGCLISVVHVTANVSLGHNDRYLTSVETGSREGQCVRCLKREYLHHSQTAAL